MRKEELVSVGAALKANTMICLQKSFICLPTGSEHVPIPDLDPKPRCRVIFDVFFHVLVSP